MDKYIREIFKDKIANRERLLSFGFEEQHNLYVYKTSIMEGQMSLTVWVNRNKVTTEVYDNQNEDQYTLFLVETITGKFVGQVRKEYEEVLTAIANHCFVTQIFQNDMTQAVIEYIKQNYHNELEFLWEKFSNNAIWRRTDNQKWYALLATLPGNKIGLESEDRIEIMDVRMTTEEIEKVVDHKKYFPGYHMNKKHWVTIVLDGSVDFQEICRRIDESYLLASKK